MVRRPGHGRNSVAVSFPLRSSAARTKGLSVEPGCARNLPATAAACMAIGHRERTSSRMAAPSRDSKNGSRLAVLRARPTAQANGRGGIPVGPISVAAPVAGLTVYKLLFKSVAYSVPPSLARLFAEVGPQGEAGDVQSANPVGPMTVVTPVAVLIESKLPEKVRVNRDPFGPGTNPSAPSGVLGPI